RETPWGRPIVLHGFEVERDGQVRGKPPLAAVVETLRLEDVYERTMVVQAILSAMYAMTIESELGGADLEAREAVFGKDGSGKILTPRPEVKVQGVKVSTLPPGYHLK